MKATIRGTEIYFDIAGMKVEPRGNSLVEKPTLFLIHSGPGGVEYYYKVMASLYYANQKRRIKQTKSKGTKSAGPKNIFSYKALNAGFGGFLRDFNFIYFDKNRDELFCWY